jgi:hypothetical protein
VVHGRAVGFMTTPFYTVCFYIVRKVLFVTNVISGASIVSLFILFLE